MEGSEEIIKSIISQAESTAAGIRADAGRERDDAFEKVRNRCIAEREKALQNARREALLIVERRLTLAALDAKKEVLRLKQKTIDAVYEGAVVKLSNMTDNIYRDFFTQLIEKHAELGDTVIVSERDVKRLNEDWLDAVNDKLDLCLSLSSMCHNDRGGIILSNDKYDKKLTLSALVHEARDFTEREVYKRLYK